jgi:GNAT superfamily N-acetyltransferase
LRAVQERIAPTVERYGNGNGDLYNSIIRTGSEMLPGVGDLVGIEDLQNAAQGNDWGGIGLGLLSAIPGIPAIGRGGRGARRAGRLLDDAPAPSAPSGGLLSGGTNAEQALARYRAAYPNDTGARVLNPGDEGYPTNAQWDEASQAYVAPRSVEDLMARAEAMGAKLDISQGNNGLTLSRIVVPPSARSQGVGSRIMRDVENYADSAGLPVGLTPSGDFGGSVPRLNEFYRRFGFMPNRGRSRDFSTRETMLRQPRAIAPVEPDYPIRAYHGSPHSFDRFSLDKIGTGEGAQAYGHGLYFAESEDVARQYRDQLSRHSIAAPDGRVVPNRTLGDDEAALEALDDIAMAAGVPELSSRAARYYNSYGDIMDTALQRSDWDGLPSTIRSLRDAEIDNLEKTYGSPEQIEAAREAYENAAQAAEYANRNNLGRHPGSMYEVGINADPNTFLDWDRPLSEQPEPVRQAYARAISRGDPLSAELLGNLSDPEAMRLAGLFPDSRGAQA